MKFNFSNTLWILFYGICFSLTAESAIPAGSVSTGTGGTGRASVAAGDSVVLNPAMLAHLRGYIFYSGYQQGQGLFSLSDNTQDTVVPTAFTFSKQNEFQNMRLTFANFIYKNISLGVSAHYSHYQKEQTQGNQWNSDIGLSILPNSHLGLGLVFSNLQGASESIPLEYRPQRKVAAGMTYLYRSFLRLRLDAESGPEYGGSNGIVMAGMESNLNRWMLLRMGYRENRFLDQKYITTGLGFDYPRFQLNYAFEAETENQKNQRHSIDLAVPL